ALLSRGDHDGAIAEYRAGFRLKTELSLSRANIRLAYHNLGMASRATGDRDGAIAAFQEVFRLRPDLDVLASLITMLKAKDRPDLGVAYFDSLIRDEPRDPRYLLARARYLADLGRFDQAEADLAKAGEDWPKDPSVPALRGHLEAVRGRLD